LRIAETGSETRWTGHRARNESDFNVHNSVPTGDNAIAAPMEFTPDESGAARRHLLNPAACRDRLQPQISRENELCGRRAPGSIA
jgi:hypothetical protein